MSRQIVRLGVLVWLCWASGVWAQTEIVAGNRVLVGWQNFCDASASGPNTYSCSMAISPGQYFTGTRYSFTCGTTNTGAATINYNGLGAKTIKKLAGSITTDLSAGDCRLGQMVDVMYDGTNMQMLSQPGTLIVVASGTLALATSAIASGVCATAQTATATGALTTDLVQAGFNQDVSGITGYTPATTGALRIDLWPTTNTVNVKVCNATSASITPGAVTLNWRVLR